MSEKTSKLSPAQVQAYNARCNELLSTALGYAAKGYFVIPLHEPLFNDAGECVGCTCEEWKRSDGYRLWLDGKHSEGKLHHVKYDPNYACPSQGKHPRIGFDWEGQASTDPQQIREWWERWPTANIGIAPGKSGIIDFDLDTYKSDYSGDELFTQADKQTATQLSGGGGEHLIYLMPPGKEYGNDAGDLPDGIDIRGYGGLFVAPPSKHKSGKLYQWEDGYSLLEMQPIPLPDKLVAILDQAHEASSGPGVSFSSPTTEKPDLARWYISARIRGLINEPVSSGKRSNADQSVLVALCYAGATDDEILAVFQHYPIGTQGKYAKEGDRYLIRSISRARAFVASHPRTVSGDYLLREGPHDEGNAQCVNRRYQGEFCINGAFGWMQYTGKRWQRDGAEEAVERAITETLLARGQAVFASGDPTKYKDLLKKAVPNSGAVQGAKNQLSSLVFVTDTEFDHNPDFLNCANGVIDLRTGTLVQHSSSQYFTYCASADYNPGKSWERWTNWLTEAVGEPSTVDWLQMAMGYTLTGWTREEIMFYLFGPTRAGKGLFLESLFHLLGDPLARAIEFSTLTAKRDGDSQNFDLAPLKPCRLVIASESNQYEKFNEAKLKHITGGDIIQCAYKHKDQFNYRPQYKIWLSSNHPVNADPDDEAAWGRIRMVEFPNSYLGKEDKSLKYMMKTPEMQDAILAWAVAGAMRWYKLGSAGLPTLGRGEALKAQQREALDTVQMWLDEKTMCKPDTFTPSQILYTSYESWCKFNGVEPKKQKSLTTVLQHKGFKYDIKKVDRVSFRGFYDLTLLRGN